MLGPFSFLFFQKFVPEESGAIFAIRANRLFEAEEEKDQKKGLKNGRKKAQKRPLNKRGSQTSG